jgi:hypothetical protein
MPRHLEIDMLRSARCSDNSRKYVKYGQMKMTLELTNQLFRKAKATAAEHGQTLEELITEALREKLLLDSGRDQPSQPEWMKGFGALKRLRKEGARVQSIVEQEFERIEPEDQR